jgi:hypothetical protein
MIKKNGIVTNQSIFINKPVEVVWTYTQNHDKRTEWDNTVLESKVLQNDPDKIVRLKFKRDTVITFIYKLDLPTYRTTFIAHEIESALIESAGGSWIYEKENTGTLWTQINTIVFREKAPRILLLPVYNLLFNARTKQAMLNAKKILEVGK